MQRDPIEQVLESALNGFQLRVEIVADLRYCGEWHEREMPATQGAFHLIDEGECVVESPSLAEPVTLRSGDLVMFPHGSGHLIRSSPCQAILGSEPSYTSLLCGEFVFMIGAQNPVLRALPDCMIVRARDGGESFAHLASLLIDTSRRERLGRQVMLNTLAASLFILAVCEFASQSTHPRGLFAALADPRLAAVIHAIHERPGDDWSIAALASIAGMSRTTFAERFSALLEIPPMQYLTQWRVSQARLMLQNRRLSVAAIAEKLGYKSEPAFRKLFKRIAGVGPGKLRSQSH
ncbi:MAG: AraC family transcriptional regulator [Dokdonella sp.]